MRYKSEIFEVVHQDAAAMFEVGAISEEKMREFDRKCLVKEAETPSKAPTSGAAPAYAGQRRA